MLREIITDVPSLFASLAWAGIVGAIASFCVCIIIVVFEIFCDRCEDA